MTRAMTTPCMMRVRRATEARAGVVAGVAAASLFVPAICRLHAAPASPSHKAPPCAAANKNAEHDVRGGVAEEEEVKVEEVSVMAVAEGLRQQATAECKERGSESEFKPTTSTVLSTGRPRT